MPKSLLMVILLSAYILRIIEVYIMKKTKVQKNLKNETKENTTKVENILKNKKYKKMLELLHLYEDEYGLELKHVVVAFFCPEVFNDKEKTKISGYMNKTIAKEAYDNLIKWNKKITELQLSDIEFTEPKRIEEVLKRLSDMGLVKKDVEGKKKIYRISQLAIALITANKEKEFLKLYNDASRLVKGYQCITRANDFVNIYASSPFKKEYEKSEINQKVKDITEQMADLLIELGALFEEVHTVWKDEDYCSWLELKSHIGIVMHIPPIHKDELLFEPIVAEKKKEDTEKITKKQLLCICPNCKTENMHGEQFCVHCGLDLERKVFDNSPRRLWDKDRPRYCPHCGKKLHESYELCPKCGIIIK
ncbi:Double zinc ribbon [Thermoplasmatales archaeon SCGC AB-539-N05]|nr:Double zinc ribbon [Thermoplasmatales archaeon SCGC AB-539-N05]